MAEEGEGDARVSVPVVDRNACGGAQRAACPQARTRESGAAPHPHPRPAAHVCDAPAPSGGADHLRERATGAPRRVDHAACLLHYLQSTSHREVDRLDKAQPSATPAQPEAALADQCERPKLFGLSGEPPRNRTENPQIKSRFERVFGITRVPSGTRAICLSHSRLAA